MNSLKISDVGGKLLFNQTKVRGAYKIRVKCFNQKCKNIFGIPDQPIPGYCAGCMLQEFLKK
jgi:hypothetical protein